MKRWNISYTVKMKGRELRGLGITTVSAPDERRALRALELQVRKSWGEDYESHEVERITECKE